MSLKTDPYANFAAFYDLYVGDRLDDLRFYLPFAKASGTPMLEVGAGSGRLTIPLAQQGVSVVAVDISPAMLALLGKRLRNEPEIVQRRVEIIEADACNLRLEKEFDLIVVPFYTFNYFLQDEQQTAALNAFAAHLQPSGRILLDVFVPWTLLAHPPTAPVLKVNRTGTATEDTIRGWNTYMFDRERQIETRRHVFEVFHPDGRTSTREFSTMRRYWFRDELTEFFQRHGFIVNRICTGYTGNPAKDDSEQLLYVLDRPRGDGSI